MAMIAVKPQEDEDPCKTKEGFPVFIWGGCIEGKWIFIEGVFLVNPQHTKEFWERH